MFSDKNSPDNKPTEPEFRYRDSCPLNTADFQLSDFVLQDSAPTAAETQGETNKR